MELCNKVTDEMQCQNELDTTGSPKWCKACRATYQKEYQALRVDKSERGGFAKGITAMRTVLAEEFERLGTGTFSGDECAYFIRQAPGPRMDD